MITSDTGLNTAMATLRTAATLKPAQADVMGPPERSDEPVQADQAYQPDQAEPPSARRNADGPCLHLPAPDFSPADTLPSPSSAPSAPAAADTTPTPTAASAGTVPASAPAATTAAPPAGANPMIGAIGSTVGSALAGGGAAFVSAKAIAGIWKPVSAAVEPAVSVAATAAASTGSTIATVSKASTGLIAKGSNFVKGVIGNLKASVPALAKGAGIGAAISGVVSLATNGYQTFVAKTMTTRQMAGAVAADTVSGAISSLGGMAAGAVVVAIAGTALAGLPLTLLTIGAGIAGSMIAGRMTDKLGIHQAIQTAVSGPATAAAAPAQ